MDSPRLRRVAMNAVERRLQGGATIDSVTVRIHIAHLDGSVYKHS